MNKICFECNIEKDVSEFSSRGGKQKHLYSSVCKLCKNTYDKEYRKNNNVLIKKNKKEYYENNKQDLLEEMAQYRENNSENIKISQKRYRENNKDKLIQRRKLHYLNNRENIIKSNTEYRKNNIKKISEYQNTYSTKRAKTDISFRLRRNISTAIYIALKGNGSSKNNVSILKHLSYSIEQLKEWLEKQFEPWMNWDNHGKYDSVSWDDHDPSTWTWQIDHIIPQSKLLYKSMEEENFQQCWALSNLRPLESKQNIIKGNK